MRELTNCRKEFVSAVGNSVVICATIRNGDDYDSDDNEEYNLYEGYTAEEAEAFLEAIDFDYDSGYGGQQLYGTVLLKEGWLSRGEYDGSEWWEHNKRPTVDELCLRRANSTEVLK